MGIATSLVIALIGAIVAAGLWLRSLSAASDQGRRWRFLALMAGGLALAAAARAVNLLGVPYPT